MAEQQIDRCPYIENFDCGSPVKAWCLEKNYKNCHSYKFLKECESIKEEKKDGNQNA